MRAFFCITILFVFTFSCQTKTGKSASEMAKFTGTIADSAAVVSAHPFASKAGIEILKKGGNAVDAAVAVHFALAVVYPRAGNIGGGGFMILREADGKLNSLDFREKCPAAGHRDLYLDADGNVVPRLSIDGHLGAGVPGSVDGMYTAHKKYGKLDWKVLLQPAIDLAEDGHMVSEIEAEYMNDNREKFDKFSTTGKYFTNPSNRWKGGDKLKQIDLAATLKRIQTNGRSGFYEGQTADLIVDEMKRSNGIITHADLLAYRSVWREPIIGNYKNDYRIISMGPPSSGGIALLQMCEMAERFPVKEWGFQSAKTAHIMIEAERLAYADRASHLGDPDFFPVPLEGLLEEQYLSQRAKLINQSEATRSKNVKAGSPKGATAVEGKMPAESNETTHYSIVDKWGNAVSITTTLNSNYGSKVFVAGAGFLLNNEMDDFSAKPGVYNQFGLLGNEANAIAPEKRMLSSMTPTIVEKEGELFMVLGTPGGATIITSVFQNILNVIEFEMSMQESVNAPRFHHQWFPDTVYVEEEAFNVEIKSDLKKMGHRIKSRGSLIDKNYIGKVDAILVRKDAKLEAAADIRGEDTALGY